MNSNIINTSVTTDPYYSIPQQHPDVDLKNNYAPISKQLRDSLSTKHVHPLAEYLDERPWYDNVIMTDRTAKDLQEARKKRYKPIAIDMVRLNGNSNKFEEDIIIGVDPLEPKEVKVGEPFKRINEINVKIADKKQIPKVKTEVKDKRIDNETFNVIGVGVKKGGARFISRADNDNNRESYRAVNSDDTYYDQIYIQSLESRLIGVVRYIEKNPVYYHWRDNWKALENAMVQSDFSFTRLNQNDKDVAYTVDKGKETKFRIRGNNNRYLPINVYQYVMLHEAAHCANFNSWGHGKDFQDLLSLLCLAAMELGFIRISAIHSELYTTNGQPVLCRGDIKNEILNGIELVKSKNPKMINHYNQFADYIRKQ